MMMFPWSKFRALIALTACLYITNSFAYEVWLGTQCTPGSAASDTASWSNAAAKIEGLNISTPPNDTDPATPGEWITIIGRFTNAHFVFVEFPRSRPSRDPSLTNALIFDALASSLATEFATATKRAYDIDRIMFYDNAIDTNNYTWTTNEVQYMRDWLDTNGHASVGLMYNARNNGTAVRNWCKHALVDDILLEASEDTWKSNAGSRQTLLPWLWTNSATVNKKLVFQIPGGSPTFYQGVRSLVRWLGNDLMGWEFLRSPRVVLLPCNYNSFTFAPDTVPGDPTLYTNSLTSVCLSLIEQRELFEARTRMPTEADVDSYVRNLAPTLAASSNYSLIAGQTLTLTNVASDANLPAQTLTFSLLNPPPGAFINPSNGVFTWRPAIAQAPSTNTVTVSASDNGSPALSATNDFYVTVIPPPKPVIGSVSINYGQFAFTVDGTNGPDYIVLASTNLTTWLPLWTNASPMLPFGFTNATTNFSQRFYRVVLAP
jgi:hypothetical protein